VTNNTKMQKSLKMLLLSSNIQHKHSHFKRGRSRQPIRVKLWRHGMCAQTITDSRRLCTVQVSVIIHPWGRKIRAYWRYFLSARRDGLIITLN